MIGPLFVACKACASAPAYRTRQNALGARPAGPWKVCCEAHKPGSALDKLPADHPVRIAAEQASFYTIEELREHVR